MVPITKTLVFLCMLIGWAQAFLHHDVFRENDAIQDADKIERERRDLAVNDFTPPVCRVFNMSAICRSYEYMDEFKVTYIMTDGDGSGIDHIKVFASGLKCLSKTTQAYGLDEDGYKATYLYYSSNCCYEDVEVLVVDKAGHTSKCPVALKRNTTTFKPMTIKTVKPTSSSSITTISLWSSLILMALKSMLL